MLLLLVESAAALCTYRKECNKYDLTTTRVSDWHIIMIGPGGLLLVVPHLLEVPVSVLWVDCHLLNLKKQRFLELGKKICLTAEREIETKKHDMDFYMG
jgi:hypothetical protein